MTNRNSNLIWIDLEMTGLIPEQDTIIEMATVVTDKDLNILSEGPVMAIHQPEAIMASMDDWNTRQHGGSGLTDRVASSKHTLRSAEEQTLSFLSKWVDKGASPICGNSIGQDRRFLVRYMPKLESYFHYRNLDVSTLKILANLWKPDVAKGFSKKGSHLALDDILESIEELKYYRQNLFT